MPYGSLKLSRRTKVSILVIILLAALAGLVLALYGLVMAIITGIEAVAR